ncbi:MAG: hypothetical protein IJ197_03005 [Bacteroidaceae bacterium]|nr:hypothetical protein [Bacteroidaceae bacterium]
MKKIYQHPTLKVAEMETEQLIANSVKDDGTFSNGENAGYGGEYDGDEPIEGDVKKGLWDDAWE